LTYLFSCDYNIKCASWGEGLGFRFSDLLISGENALRILRDGDFSHTYQTGFISIGDFFKKQGNPLLFYVVHKKQTEVKK